MLFRSAVIEYKHKDEKVYRTTNRAMRTVAVLHREGDLELTQQLSAASREADRLENEPACMVRPLDIGANAEVDEPMDEDPEVEALEGRCEQETADAIRERN